MKDLVKVRITHDGNGPAKRAKVTEIETGREIVFIRKVLIDIHPDNFNEATTATIQFYNPRVDMIANADITQVCPCCGKPVKENGQHE